MRDNHALLTADHAPVEHFDWGQLHWYASGDLQNSATMTVGRCVLRPGCGNPVHYHPNCEEVLHVLAGKIEHFVQGRGWFPMEAGSTITIPANIRHGARNVGTDEAHLLICFSSASRETIGEAVDAGR